ncbi:MAG: deoxyribose-phosphate aldolase [Thermoplasmata archaeon]|nr:deoxyribose-phosphate aldolase [Thermoplasmata archaeon]
MIDNKIAGMIDHTLLKANATSAQIEKLCAEARQYNFASVCVAPTWVELCRSLVMGSPVKVCAVIGFPLGNAASQAKTLEAKIAVEDGADELDLVMNIGKLLDGDYDFVRDDIQSVVAAANGRLVKVIIEFCYLNEEQIIKACQLSKEAGAQFVKTSTGFGTSGATVEAVKLMRQTVGPDIGVKASGGIRNRDDALVMIKAGANRIGTSAGIAIVEAK